MNAPASESQSNFAEAFDLLFRAALVSITYVTPGPNASWPNACLCLCRSNEYGADFRVIGSDLRGRSCAARRRTLLSWRWARPCS